MSSVTRLAGGIITRLAPQCRFNRALFIVGHMRCGSTALSNILCSRYDVSGYGEAHIHYQNEAALGVLLLNQLKHKAWRPRSVLLFDKILHNRYDTNPPPSFFESRAIFVVRSPVETIVSIRNLFAKIRSTEYDTDAKAATYYKQRLQHMLALWTQFPKGSCIGVSHRALTADPDRQLLCISAGLGFDPPLENVYRQHKSTARHGAGDPLSSHKFDRIVGAKESSTVQSDALQLDIPDQLVSELEELYQHCITVFECNNITVNAV